MLPISDINNLMALTFRKFFESKDILITEANVDDVYQRYYKDVIEREVFDKIVSMFRKNYQVRWTIDAYKNINNDNEKKRFINEDMPKLIDLFKKLETYKQKNVSEAKNLNIFALKTIPELYRSIQNISGGGEDVSGDEDVKQNSSEDSLQQTKERNIGKGGFIPKLQKLYENGTYIVVRPEDEASLNAVSRNTAWCTDSEKSDYHGSHYVKLKNKRGDDNRLYLVENKNDKKDRYLISFIEHQIMDRSDADQSDNLEDLNPELLDALFNLGSVDEVTAEIEASPRSAATFYILMELLGK
jgi:hypothetical protein